MKGDIGKLLAVYPRVCGATVLVWRSRKRATGLSPRVRGNRCHRRRRLPIRWSIPACAGQPRSFTMIRIMHWVYPRVCGATFISLPDRVTGVGLSPRVRGNHNLDVTITVNDRSIPACAGQPTKMMSIVGIGMVYPRVCGATTTLMSQSPSTTGLSPRVRGNRPK